MGIPHRIQSYDKLGRPARRLLVGAIEDVREDPRRPGFLNVVNRPRCWVRADDWSELQDWLGPSLVDRIWLDELRQDVAVSRKERM